MSQDLIDVSLVTSAGVLFKGEVHSVILPGEQGVFEVLPHHKSLLSLLLPGDVILDERVIRIRRGIAKVLSNNTVEAIVEVDAK